MPAALSSSVGSGSTPGSTTGAARSTGTGKDFGQMLQGPSAADTQAKPAGNTPPARHAAASSSASPNPDRSADRTATSHKDDDASTAGATASTTANSTASQEKDPDKDSSADGDDAPWPPLGLAGLVLAAPAPAEAGATAPVVTTDVTDASLPAAAPALPTTPALAAGAAAAGAATATAADSEGEVATQALPGTILGQQALDGADDGDSLKIGDSTPPVPLQGPLPAALQDLKAALASTTVFNGEPTPTPTLGDDGFDQALGARLGWLADQKIGHAHIRLNPEDLGPVDVRLQMNGDKVHASFSSPHVDVRQALEHSLPRLRELLGEQGFQLAHADVGQQHSGDGSPSGQPTGAGNGVAGGDGEPTRGDATMSAAQLIRQRGLLDAYA